MAITVETWNGPGGALDLDSATYHTYLAVEDSPYMQEREVVLQSPLVGPQRYVRSASRFRTLPLHVEIISGDFQSGWETLSQAFAPGAKGELIVSFGAVSRAIDCVVRQIIPFAGSPNAYTVVLHGPDPRWRSADVQRTSQSVTASPTTWAVTNDGNTPDDAPVVRIQPYTAQAAASGQRYLHEIVIANRLARAFTNYALELTENWAHATEAAAGRSDTTGKDVRVYVDGVEVDRWDGENAATDWNSATTNVWINIDLAPRVTAVLRTATTATSPLNGEDVEVYSVDGLPERGAMLFEDEVIEWCGTTPANANGLPALQHVIRGARNTTAAIHAVDVTGYLVEKRVQILYGWTSAPTYTERTDTKPMLDLTSATLTNLSHQWLDFADSRYPARSMGWKRTLASRDDQSTRIVEATGGPLAAMAAQYYAAGAQAGKPVANQWERHFPSGLATSASALSFVTTRAADMGMQTLGVDADGNEVILNTGVGTASGATVNVTPGAALYDVRFWTFNPILWKYPTTMTGAGASLSASQADVGQRITIGDEPVTVTHVIARMNDSGLARNVICQIYADAGASGMTAAALIATSDTVATPATGIGETLFTFATPPELKAGGKYWVSLYDTSAVGTLPNLQGSYPVRANSATRPAGGPVADPATIDFQIAVLGYRGSLAATLERLDTNGAPTDGNSTSIASLTAVLDSSGVPYVAMQARQDGYVLDATLRNLATGQALDFATPLRLLDKIEVDVRERAVRNLAECPYALTLSGNEITDVVRAAGTQGDGRTVPDGSMGIWPAATNIITNGGFETNTTGLTPQAGASVARITTDAAFGGACAEVTNTGGNKGAEVSATAAASTTYTGTGYAKTTAGRNLRGWLRFYAAGVEQAGLRQTVNAVATGGWQRITVSGTGDGSTDQIKLLIWMVEDATFKLDGLQCETGPIATPYIDTDGATATRAAARVRLPVADLFTEEQFVIFGCITPRWSAAAEPGGGSGYAFIADWRDAADDRISLSYDEANNRLLLERITSAGTDSHTFAATIVSGTPIDFMAAGTTTALRLSVDGAALTETASTRIPTLAAAQMDLGQSAAANHIASDVHWLGFAKGTVVDADASVTAAYSTTDPDPDQLVRDLAPEVLPTALWWADSGRFFRLDRPAGERGASLVQTLTPSHSDWLRLEAGQQRLALDSAGVAGLNVEVLMHDRWS